MSTLLLHGNIDRRDEELQELREQLETLKDRNIDLEAEMSRLRRENTRAVAALRRQLTPLYQALQLVFGELDAIGGDTSEAAPSASKWDLVKAKMPPRHRECIDLLLVQGTMARKQVASAMKMNYTNCATNVIAVLIRQGWLIDNGRDGVSLKQL